MTFFGFDPFFIFSQREGEGASLLFLFQLSLALLLGLSFGSFYTALGKRILYFFYGAGRKAKGSRERWKSLFLRPSFCFSCQRRIALEDLLPIWGYLRNKGCCRYCHTSIGIETFLGEVYMGFLAFYLMFCGLTWPLLLLSLLFCGHLYISFLSDSRLFLLDPENALFLFLWTLLYLYLKYGFDRAAMQLHLLAFAASLLFFLLLFFLGAMRALGFGDVILACVIALFLGLPWALLVFQIAAAASIVYIVFIKKKLRSPAPLGAMMALSVFVILPIAHSIE